jgi:outer membrane lipoprotein
MQRVPIICLLMAALSFSACAQSAHQTGRYLIDRAVPKDVLDQVDSSVAFPDLRNSPSSYQGRVLMLSGVVLNAKRRADHTEIEVLQLPSDSGVAPTADRRRSEGRFLAVQEGLDPATVEVGTPITVVGEVKGETTRPLDQSQYTYPVVEVKKLIDWEKTLEPRYAQYGPYWGGYRFYPYAYSPYGGPYSYWGYPYWGYYPFAFGFRSAPAPPPPPPASVPPQFQKE